MDAMKDLRSFILIMVILAFVWLFTGGPLRPSSESGWFLNKPQQKATQKRRNKRRKYSGQKARPKKPSKLFLRNNLLPPLLLFLTSGATTAARLRLREQVTMTTKQIIRLLFFRLSQAILVR